MPRYRVTSPDGVTYMVDAPDGMSDEQVIAYARQPHNFTGPATAEDKNAVQSLPGGQSIPVNPLTIALGSALVGAGRTGSKIEAGNQQLLTNAKIAGKELVGNGNTSQDFQSLNSLAQMQRDNDAAYGPLRQQHPFFTGVGETLPTVAIPVGQASAAGRVFAPAMGLSAMEGAQYGSPMQRGIGATIGAVLGAGGGAAGELLNTAISPAASSLSGAKQAAVNKAADKIGVNVLPSQLTGNSTLAGIEDTLSRLPLSRNVFADLNAGNRRTVNKLAASAMGEDSDALTKDVLAGAKDRLGTERDALRAQASMNASGPVFDAITQSERLLNSGLPVNGKAEALQTLSDLKQRLYGTKQLTGDEYQAIASDLKTAARGTQNQTIAAAYKQVVKAMDQEARGANAPAWEQNDRQYAAMKTLMKPNVVNEVTGDVNAGPLSRAMDRQFGESAKTGAVKGPLADISEYYKALPPMQAGSPTFERGATNNPLQWMASPGYWLAAKALTSQGGRDYLSGGLLGNPAISAGLGKLASRGALPLALSPAEQALFNMGLLSYAQ